MTGIVVLMHMAGRGEIRPEDGGDRIRFDRADVLGDFPSLLGQRVSYGVLHEDGRPPRAMRVRAAAAERKAS